jgi:hypothetical protein
MFPLKITWFIISFLESMESNPSAAEQNHEQLHQGEGIIPLFKIALKNWHRF